MLEVLLEIAPCKPVTPQTIRVMIHLHSLSKKCLQATHIRQNRSLLTTALELLKLWTRTGGKRLQCLCRWLLLANGGRERETVCARNKEGPGEKQNGYFTG